MPRADYVAKIKANPERWAEFRAKRAEALKQWKARNPERVRQHKARNWAGSLEYNHAWAALNRAAARQVRREAAPTGTTRVDLSAAQMLDLREQAERLVPAFLPQFVREDAVSDLCLGVLAGDFPASAMPRHARAIVARHRGLTSKFSVSVDDVTGEDGYTRGHSMGVY
jgi:hypothetical protein